MSESHEDETANLQARIARLRKIIPHYIEYNKGRIDISASLLDQVLGKVEELTETVRVLSASEFNLAGHLVKVEAINKSLKESIKDTEVESGECWARMRVAQEEARCSISQYPVIRLEDLPVSEAFWEGVDAILRQSKRTYNDNMSLDFSDGKALGYFLCEVLPLRSE